MHNYLRPRRNGANEGLHFGGRGRPLVLDIRIDREVRMPKNGRNEDMKTTVPAKRALN